MAQQKTIRNREVRQIVSLLIYIWARKMTSPQDSGQSLL